MVTIIGMKCSRYEIYNPFFAEIMKIRATFQYKDCTIITLESEIGNDLNFSVEF